MNSRIMGLLACTALISLSGCGGERSLQDLCLDQCANMASANCKSFGDKEKTACDDKCKNAKEDNSGDKKCESEGMALAECIADAKYECVADMPVMGKDQCKSELEAAAKCMQSDSK